MSRKPHTEPDFDTDFDGGEEIEYVSKSAMKREVEALQDLGVQLIALSKGQLKKLNLPDNLLTAIKDAQKITANGAIKRQRQYIGRLMRDVDPAPIQAFLDSLRGDNERLNAWFHELERQRDELVASDEAVAKLIAEHRDIDIQQLRTMVRNARAERAANKPPKHYRALYQFIKSLSTEPALIAAEVEDEDDEDHDA
ncbi:ribosome biogenesis factor YjgA [Chitinimonas taiwanensis]|jgi:ribosome-associated protein|uniref:Dual-action ribosomal maturation protein DarP n=1 Tax=Chitinimonas taiwanensis DSM 18899 TaxID=1121279 RepID=A0A1K2HPG1_9NEIS|nr:ribosome biogenesis factor YjgA [Chitinimonas taiwanensis]SFZ78662.1 ribosome-associated protein [Chitinimonas taiwanensis DSM 18899]